MSPPPPMPAGRGAPLPVVAWEWTRIGVTGFGGPPAHIALLRQLMVDRTSWMDAREFQDANAACGLLPGPASTQLSIFCAYRVAGPTGAIIGGIGFIAPAVILILALSLLFLAHSPPVWVRGAGAGASAVVAAVAVQAARGLIGPSLERVRSDRPRVVRWSVYVMIATAAAGLFGPYLVLALLACGLIELVIQHHPAPPVSMWLLVPGSVSAGGIGALAWTAFKVGALSFGGAARGARGVLAVVLVHSHRRGEIRAAAHQPGRPGVPGRRRMLAFRHAK